MAQLVFSLQGVALFFVAGDRTVFAAFGRLSTFCNSSSWLGHSWGGAVSNLSMSVQLYTCLLDFGIVTHADLYITLDDQQAALKEALRFWDAGLG